MAGNTVRIKAVLDDQVSGGLDKIRDRFDRLGKNKGAQSVLQGVGVGAGISAFNLLGSAAGTATSIIESSIAAASDLNESVSKSKVVFGDSADEIEKWAETSATAMGISKQAALEQSGTLGNLLLSMGKTSSQAAEMSKTMVQLAADLGSFNNVDAEEVLVAMRSGLTGEIAPLRRFGVNLTDVTLKAKAMELGLYDGVGAIDVNAKSSAAYALILEQTTTAQGDFARTSKGMANQQKILTAQLQDSSAELGGVLIPYVIDAQRAIIDLSAAGSELKDVLAGVSEETDGLSDKLLSMVNTGFRPDKVVDFATSAQQAVTDFVTGAGDDLDTFAGKAADDLNLTGATGKMRDDLVIAGTAAKDFATDAEEVAEIKWATVSAAQSFEDMKDSMVSSASDAIDDAFDPLIARNNLLAANAEIAAARRVLASKTATSAEKADARDTLASVGKDQAGYLLELAESGKTGFKAYKDGMAALKTAIASSSGTAKKELQAVYDWIIKVERAGKNVPINVHVSGNVGAVSGFGGGKAAGGPVAANTMYVVGENGPELFMPDSSGQIIPNGGSRTGGSGGGATIIHTHIYLDGREIAEVVDEEAYLKQQRAAPTATRV